MVECGEVGLELLQRRVPQKIACPNLVDPVMLQQDPGKLPAYLAVRGFMLLEDMSADKYRERYFGDAARAMRGYSFYRAAVARVLAPPALTV